MHVINSEINLQILKVHNCIPLCIVCFNFYLLNIITVSVDFTFILSILVPLYIFLELNILTIFSLFTCKFYNTKLNENIIRYITTQLQHSSKFFFKKIV